MTRPRKSVRREQLDNEPLLVESEANPLAYSTCRVEATRQAGSAIYTLIGELNSSTAGEVRSFMAPANEESSLVFNLLELTALDADGIDVIREIIGNIYLHGGRAAISRSWRLAMAMTGLLGTMGLVFISFSTDSSIGWLERLPPSLHLSTSDKPVRTFSGDQLTLGS
jgi:anti-anti-sigma regulatory factor